MGNVGRQRANGQSAARALTPREAEVLAALARGWSVPDIARQGVVSVATVRSQIRSILTKLGATDEEEAIRWAVAGSGSDLPT